MGSNLSILVCTIAFGSLAGLWCYATVEPAYFRWDRAWPAILFGGSLAAVATLTLFGILALLRQHE